MTTGLVKVGPWGGNDGTREWKFHLLDEWKLSKIAICRDTACVHSIQFYATDKQQKEHKSELIGGTGGGPPVEAKFDLDESEELNEISGTYGKHDGRVVITSLLFKTNLDKEYGPYGAPPGDGTAFSIPMDAGRFVRFYGKHGKYLDNLAVQLEPEL